MTLSIGQVPSLPAMVQHVASLHIVQWRSAIQRVEETSGLSKDNPDVIELRRIVFRKIDDLELLRKAFDLVWTFARG
ncbi:MAG TPA: hypothetical protein VL991_01975 [Terracidiphilus sp.]|nr:hypothetical protein [Terracidiphilus sp.]